jgi:hypothetical protein
MYSTLTAYAASQVFSRVDIPKPDAPDADDIVDKSKDGGDWLAQRGQSFWIIVIVLVVALVLTKALKNPLVKGILIGVALIAVVGAIMTK